MPVTYFKKKTNSELNQQFPHRLQGKEMIKWNHLLKDSHYSPELYVSEKNVLCEGLYGCKCENNKIKPIFKL